MGRISASGRVLPYSVRQKLPATAILLASIWSLLKALRTIGTAEK